VAEWQTQGTQNPPSERACGFESRLRYQLESQRPTRVRTDAKTSGASLAEIAEATGHKTLAMVKRYAHLSRQHIRGVVTQMYEEFFG